MKHGPLSSRRRVISILAAAGALSIATGLGLRARPQPHRWKGIALGASADLTLYAETADHAAEAIGRSLEEIARLESIFSLHQTDSALNRLNRDGRLSDPPSELVELLSWSLGLGEISGGRFDPTVQPLWRLIADHFARPDADPAGPSPALLATARALVDGRQVAVSPGEIVFGRKGMQVTLNGVAQGYISDRVAALLRAQGMIHTLVNLGEAVAIDRRGDGQPWRIGVPAPADRSRLVATIELSGGAVATSAARGLCFDAMGRFNHIIDPTRLACADLDRSVTVVAPSAELADGLSTLGALVPDADRDLSQLLTRFGARAFLISSASPQGRWLAA